MPAGLKLAYVEVRTVGGLFGPGETARGHVYHHSEIEGEVGVERCYHLQTPNGDESDEGYQTGNVLASYVHLHFASNPRLAAAIVDACESFREARSAEPVR
jgi:cobyrinic acid a,c-diamide synthase